jgi:hypothetical protein
MTEPIPYVTTRYRCPHCTRTSRSARALRPHIAVCVSDPASKACATCWRLEDDECVIGLKTKTYEASWPDGADRLVSVRHCPQWIARPTS